jgi:MOSC N-terminal beta barrel domain
MPKATEGSVASLWRYPVKSMLGEELSAVEVTERGLLGDRAYALVDKADGKTATAKNPRKWPTLFGFRAAFIEPPRPGASVPPVRITLPDGTIATSHQADLNQVLSRALGRTVTLDPAGLSHAGPVNAEEYWPDMEGLDHRDTVTDFALPEGTFFDCATVHLLTTATLARLHQLSARALRGPALSSQRRRGACLGRDGLRRECLGPSHARHRRFGPLQHHGTLRPLCHDDPTPRRPAARSGHSAHGGPAQQRQCRCLCDGRAWRHDSSWRCGQHRVGHQTEVTNGDIALRTTGRRVLYCRCR